MFNRKVQGSINETRNTKIENKGENHVMLNVNDAHKRIIILICMTNIKTNFFNIVFKKNTA